MAIFPCFFHNNARPLLVLLFAIVLASSLRADDFGEVTVNIESVLVVNSYKGYDEYRATITNRSPNNSHRVRVGMFASNWGGRLGEVQREAEVGPASSVTISIFTSAQHAGNTASIWVDNVKQREAAKIDLTKTNTWKSRPQNRYFLLLSENVDKAQYFESEIVAKGFSGYAGVIDVAYNISTTAPSDWSPHWLGYSSFSSIAITAEELSSMPAAQQQTLLQFAETGGVLIIVGEWLPPSSWRADRAPVFEVLEEKPAEAGPSSGPDPAARSKPIVSQVSEKAPNLLDSYETGFGMVVVTGKFPFNQITSGQWRYIKQFMEEREDTGRAYSSLPEFNKKFAVVDRLSIPVRGLFALILFFVVLIGPVNFFWLAGPGKRMRMLWTVPVISLSTCLAVAGFSLYGEGRTATSRVESFTILNEVDHRATTIGVCGFYTPTTTDGLHFSLNTELSQLTWEVVDRNSLGIDYTHDQHLSPGWVTPRVPAFFGLRKSEMRRERLPIQFSSAGVPLAVNGLGVPIKQIWVSAPTGQLFVSENIEPGASVTLHSFENRNEVGGFSHNHLFQSMWIELFQTVEQYPWALMKPGSYLALVDRNPFVEDALANVATRRGRSFIYGRIPEGAK